MCRMFDLIPASLARSTKNGTMLEHRDIEELSILFY